MTNIRVETITASDGLNNWGRLQPRSYCRQSAPGIGGPARQWTLLVGRFSLEMPGNTSKASHQIPSTVP